MIANKSGALTSAIKVKRVAERTFHSISGYGADEIVMFGMNEVAPYLWDPPFVDVCNVAYLINPDVWESMPSDIQAILKYATRELDLWNETVRSNGEFLRRTDGSFTEVCYLPEEDISPA